MQAFPKNIFLLLTAFLFAGMLVYNQPNSIQAADPDEPPPVGDVGYCAVRTTVTPEGCGFTIRSNCGGSFYPSSVGGAEAACRAAVASQVSPPTSTTPPPATTPPPPAQGFIPLTGLPGLTDSPQERTLADYINVLYRLSIGIGALIGVIKITYAGILYMSTDAFGSKEAAKKDIYGVLIGLLVMLSTVVILQLIYPGILNLNPIQRLRPIQPLPYSGRPPSFRDNQQCTVSAGQCPGACYQNVERCIHAEGNMGGVCRTSCTPTTPATGAPGSPCERRDQCQSGLVCKVTTPRCGTATQATGPGQCLDANCRIP